MPGIVAAVIAFLLLAGLRVAWRCGIRGTTTHRSGGTPRVVVAWSLVWAVLVDKSQGSGDVYVSPAPPPRVRCIVTA